MERRASVIVPAYNSERFIAQTLQSALDQNTHDRYDIVVVNDGSNDDTSAIARQFEKTTGNITVVDQENKGAAAARNKAVEQAAGDVLIFLDGDDILMPDAVKVVTSVLELPDIEYVFSNHEAFNDSGVLYRTDKRQYLFEQVRFGGIAEDEVSDFSCWHGHVKAIDRKTFEKIGGFDEQFEAAEDYDLILRVYENLNSEQIEFVSDILYRYRVRNDSLSSTTDRASFAKLAIKASLARRGRNAEEVILTGRNRTGLLHYAYRDEQGWHGTLRESMMGSGADLHRGI